MIFSVFSAACSPIIENNTGTYKERRVDLLIFGKIAEIVLPISARRNTKHFTETG